MLRILAAALLVALAPLPASAGSTINPAVPAQNAPLSSAPVRGNFQAAYNDVNSILGMFAGATAPPSPTQGQDWLNTTTPSSATWNKWDATTGTWVVVGTFNLSTGTFTSSTLVVGTSVITSGTASGVLYNNGGVLGNLVATINGVLVTNGSGVPSVSATLPSGLVIPGFQSSLSSTAWSFVGNLTSGAATRTDFSIDGLPLKASPATGDEIFIWDVAGSAVKKTTAGAFTTVGSVASVNGLTGAVGLVPTPQGRLTLVSGVPVICSNATGSCAGVTGATTVYWTPYLGNYVPIFNGSQFVPTACAEITNNLANSSTGSAGPFATVGNALYDLFVWNNSGTCTLTRGDYWQQTATVTFGTLTSGMPIVINQTNHGFYAGASLRLSCIGGGSLPGPLTQNTPYFVRVQTTNTFQIASTFGGSVINSDGSASTCGTSVQVTEALTGANTNNPAVSGVATGRGTAPGLTLLNGIYVNTNSITNGPTAQTGTYVGTIFTTAGTTGAVDFLPGSSGPAHLHVWNMYNRTVRSANVLDAGPYTYATAAWRIANSANVNGQNAISFIAGQREDGTCNQYEQQVVTTASAGSKSQFAVAFDTPFSIGNVPTPDTGPITIQTDAAIAHTGASGFGFCHNSLAIGWHEFEAIENGDGTNANTFAGQLGGGAKLSMTTRN